MSSHLSKRRRALVASAFRLPVTPAPLEGESLRGYLLRLSSANGYASPFWLKELEPSLSRRTDESAVITALERLTGNPSVGYILQSLSGTHNLQSRFKVSRPRICPMCVKERAYQAAVWEVIFACVCPLHKILLVDTCSKCGSRLSWNRLGVTRCSCGADLTAEDVVSVGKHLQYLNAKIWSAAGLEVYKFEHLGFPDKDLSELSLEQLSQLYWFLSSYGNGKLHLNRSKPDSIAAAVKELEVVRPLLADWPSGLHRLLDSQRDKAERFMGEGLQQAFGKFYRDLYGMLAFEKYSFIREAFEEYIRTRWVGIIDGKYKRITSDKAHNDSLCLEEASKQLGISRGRLRKFVNLGVLKGFDTERPSGRHHTVISKGEVRRFSKKVRHLLNRKETRALLGVSEKQFQMLIEAGVIRPLARVGEGKLSQWIIDSRHIRKILKEILLVVPHRLPDCRAMPFMNICKLYLLSARHFPAFLEAVRNGTVPVAGINTGNKLTLASLYFLPESIAEFRKGLGKRQISSYSIPQVAARLGVKQEVAYYLVKVGLLATVADQSSKRDGRVITEDGINDFESTYVSLVQLARTHGTSGRILQNKLACSGILPITGRPVDECRQIFYRRSDIQVTEQMNCF